MQASTGRALRVLLVTDVFPPRSGGSGWSTFYLGKALHERGHAVHVLRPIYGAAVARPTIRRSDYDGLPIEEVHLPAPPKAVGRLGAGPAWQERAAVRILTARASWLISELALEVVHAQHMVSALATVRAVGRARTSAARVASVATVRDYWPLCPNSTRLFVGPNGEMYECRDCHHWPVYLRCATQRGGAHLVVLALARWLRTLRAAHTLATCDAVIAVSRYVRGELAQSGRIPADRLHAIPNLVHLPSVDAALASPWPLTDLSEKRRFVLFAGKLDHNKGASMLPEVLSASGVSLPLVVAGSGPLRGSLEVEARRRGLDFRFYDWLDNDSVLRLMASSSALLFPSAWQEPLSRVLLEGMAAGAAVVALDTGGTEDIIEPGVSGWLAQDADELAVGLRRVVADAELRANLSAGARARAETHFAAPVVASRVESLYRSLLAGIGAA